MPTLRSSPQDALVSQTSSIRLFGDAKSLIFMDVDTKGLHYTRKAAGSESTMIYGFRLARTPVRGRDEGWLGAWRRLGNGAKVATGQ